MSDRFEKIRKKYIGTFAEKQNEIQTAWDNKDVARVHELMHKLAGSSGGYGFEELSSQVQDCMKLTLNSTDLNSDKIKCCINQINSTLLKTYESHYLK